VVTEAPVVAQSAPVSTSVQQPDPVVVATPTPPPVDPNVDEKMAKLLASPIANLVTTLPYKALEHEGINTIGQLVNHSREDLLDIRNFGPKSADQIEAKLAAQDPPLYLKGSAATA
jgi:DNA-directed RNA polymerase alpha subunit